MRGAGVGVIRGLLGQLWMEHDVSLCFQLDSMMGNIAVGKAIRMCQGYGYQWGVSFA